jgi:hypothetical protein
VNDDVTPRETQGVNRLSRLPISETMKGDRSRNSCLGFKSMTTLEERLEDWIFKRCQEKNPDPRQFTRLNTVFRDIYNDPRFCRYRDSKNPDDYEDALCLMWRYFLRNLCEVKGKASASFLDTRTYAVRRLLASLKGNLTNVRNERLKREGHQEPHRVDDSGNIADPVVLLTYPEPEPDLEPDPEMVFEMFLKLLEEDRTGELNADVNTLRGLKKSTKETTQETYTLTAQDYLLMRYRDKKTDQQIANELDMPRQSLQRHVGKPKKWEVLEHNLAQIAKNLVLEEGGYNDI